MEKANGEKLLDVSSQIPGEIHRDIPGFRVNDPLNEGIRKGKLGNLIEKLHGQGKDIVARRDHGKIVLYVAASAILIGAITGGIRLRKRKNG